MRTLLVLVLTFLTISDIFAYSKGPPDNVVGNPGTCNQCHNSFAVNSGSGSIRLDGFPHNVYEPGKEYTVEISLEQSGQSRFGFEGTALLSSDKTKRAGEIIVLEKDLTQVSSAGGDKPQYIKHKQPGTFAGMVMGTAQWVFKWVAPPAGKGDIIFYFACNAASNDNTNQGDYIYTTRVMLKEAKADSTQPAKVPEK